MIIPWAKPSITKKDIFHAQNALKSQWISLGDYVYKLEKRLKNFLKVNYLGVVSSGTAAINLAYLVLALKPGDEIIVPGFGYLAAANIAKSMGLKVVFADVDPNTFCVSFNTISKVLTKKTKAIVVVHTYGNVCEMKQIVSLSKRKGIYLIEDAAEAFGSKYDGNYAGTIGDIGVFSFQATKTITTGEGGAICVKNKNFYKKLILFRSHGVKKKRYFHIVPGHNFRLSNILASIGYSQLSRLNSIFRKRRKMYLSYKKNLKGDKFSFQVFSKNVSPIPWTLSIKLDKKFTHKLRDRLILKLKKKGIETRNGFYCPNELPIYSNKNKLPNSMELSKRTINLPIFEELKLKQIKYICKKFREITNK